LKAAVFVQTGETAVIVGVVPPGLTVTDVVLLFVHPFTSVTEYVIVKVPAPAVAGLKVPFAAFVIPVPLHVPPAGDPLMLKGAVLVHTAETAVIVTTERGFTVTVTGIL
jgi:hypothetical protein